MEETYKLTAKGLFAACMGTFTSEDVELALKQVNELTEDISDYLERTGQIIASVDGKLKLIPIEDIKIVGRKKWYEFWK